MTKEKYVSMTQPNINENPYKVIVDQIVFLLQKSREKVSSAINSVMTETYWHIGKYIVDFEQGGMPKVAYGTSTLTQLSQVLTAKFGRGFSRPNLVNMRKFYLSYPNCQTMSDNLSWSHILKVEYATYGMDTQLFVSKYQLYLPNIDELKAIVNRKLEK